MECDGIGLAAARTLLLDRLGSCPPGAVLRQLVDETGGNPLALLELAQDAYGGAAAGRVEDAFRRRAERLPAASRRALLIAAASDTEELETVRAAARTAGVPDDAFEAPAASGLLRIDGSELSFRHPITGVPLPFVSYGGSSLLFSMIGAGLLLNVARQAQLPDARRARATPPPSRRAATAAR